MPYAVMKLDEARAWLIHLADCPKCGARADTPCVGSRGQERAQLHMARVELANKIDSHTGQVGRRSSR